MMKRIALATVMGACLTALALQSAPLSPPAGGLLLRLRFNRLHKETTPDASGRDGTVQVAEALCVKGVEGTALDFSPPNAGVTCMDMPELPAGNGLTLEAWITIHEGGPGQWGTVIRKEGAYALRFTGNRLGLLIWSGNQVNALSTNRTDWQPGQWIHVAGTYDGNALRLFIDGEEDPASPKPLSVALNRGGGPCCVGSVRDSYAFNGAIDEARVYGRALTLGELRASRTEALKAMKAQASLRVKPQNVGRRVQAFRKPPRAVTMVQAGYLWVDAEDFGEYGGWRLDTQFVHLMGSGYLLAAGVGRPVEDARTTITVPQSGTYRVWVRSRNWVREHAPGKFEVLVNGTPMPTVLGAAPTAEWTWENAGDVRFNAGTATLALHDLTGYYGRCDALVLTTDMTYVPPEEREQVCRERARLTELSRVPQPKGEFDVVVVGAGAAGCCAAIAAARMGAVTALIQNRPVLGGNASSECGVGLNGASSHHRNARETGIPEEVARIRSRYGYRKYSEPFRMLTASEPNLTVFLNSHVFEAERKDSTTIALVRAVDTLTGAITEYRGKHFIDCTGDGWLGFFAKADFRIGREARDAFDEDLAPRESDRITMSGCLMGNGLAFRAHSVNRPVSFQRPPWARHIETLGGYGRRLRNVAGGEWWMEHPGTVDDLWQAEEARDELIKISFSYWDFIKNRSPLKEQARSYILSHIPIVDAKRESRRLMGDYILNQNDCENGRVFPDRISYGGWPLDVHHPAGIFSGDEGSFDFNKRVPVYTIPYRCIYSRNIGNLHFAGRCASVTHVALGTIRVQNTLATLGQADGTAAAICVQRGITPRQIHRNHMPEFQQILLRHDQTIPELANQDPADLARKASVTASSTADFIRFTRSNMSTETLHLLDHDRGMIFQTAGMETLSRVAVKLASENDHPTAIELHVRTARKADDFSAEADVTVVPATIPPNAENWVEFNLELDVNSPFLWCWLPRTEGISWRLMKHGPTGCSRIYGQAAANSWTPRPGEYYAIDTVPALAVPTTFAPANVINGYARESADHSNMWASDPDAPFPQWIQLELPEKCPVTSVYLTFDTDLDPRLGGPAFPRECVRDYSVAVNHNGKWKTVAEVNANFQRRRIHRFERMETDQIRLTVTNTHGDRSARVFEIRAYDE